MWNDYKKRIIGDWIEKVEGGYVNLSSDPGGETKYGISKKAFPNLDIKNLTLDQALGIYYQKYWIPNNLDSYTFPTAFVMFDCAVLCGSGWLNTSISKARAIAGAKSYKNENMLIDALISLRINYHTDDRNFPTFGKGWMRRVANLLEEYVTLQKTFGG
jgi:lysozyme family protein